MAVTSLQPFPSVRFFSINWTLDNYRYIFTFPAIQRALVNSVVLAFGAAAVGTILAAALGYFTVKRRSEEHTSELQSLLRNSYAVFCLKQKKRYQHKQSQTSIQ